MAPKRVPILDRRKCDFFATVGPAKRKYHLHRALLCKHSAAFNASYGPDSQWLERDVNNINLPNELPQVFDIFTKWLYKGSLEDITIGGHDLPLITPNSLPAHILLYRFADERCFLELKKDIVSKVMKFYGMFSYEVRRPTLLLVYATSPPDCELRRFMARAWVFNPSFNRLMGSERDSDNFRDGNNASSDDDFSDDLKADIEYAKKEAMARKHWMAKVWEAPSSIPWSTVVPRIADDEGAQI